MIAGALVSDTNRSIATAMRLRPVKGHCIERYGVRMANEKAEWQPHPTCLQLLECMGTA
jgi:hypothetical protein